MGFSEMTTLTLQFAVAKMDGIMGMGFPEIAMNKLTPFMVLLKNQKKIDTNVVQFALEHTGEESDMTIGGEDSTKTSEPFTYHNVIQKGYWMINIDSVKLGDKVVGTNIQGIVDTGTSIMVGSKKSVGAMAALSVKQDCSSDLSTLPDVTFTISGKD